MFIQARVNKRTKLNEKIIVEVGHATEIYGPVQALRDYLVHNSNNFHLLLHPLEEGTLNSSMIYYNGKHVRSIFKMKNRYLQYFIEFLLTSIFLFKVQGKINLYFGLSNFDTLPGLFFKRLGKIQKVIFYSVDFNEKRFQNCFLNKIYYFLDAFSVKHCDYVFSNSGRTSEIRRKQGLIQEREIIVRNGVYLERIPSLMLAKDANKTMFFVGHLSKAHGLQYVISILPEIIKLIPDIKLYIIGSGPLENEFKNICETKKLSRNMFFFGLRDNKEVLKILSSGGIGLAPYALTESWTKYCDPVKVKEYLACGCPIIISDVPEISKEIEVNKVGLVYHDMEELKKSILIFTINPNIFMQYRMNAINLSKVYDWQNIFDDAFRKISGDHYSVS